MRVLYIAGLSHSGSTLVSLMLGCHPQIRGIGEAARIMADPEKSRFLADGWPLWEQFYEALDRNDPGTAEGRYAMVGGLASERWGDVTLVDSSHSHVGLRMLLQMPEVEVRVVHLVRDYRSWVVSKRDLFRKGDYPERGIRLWINNRRRMNSVRLARLWERETRATMAELTDVPAMTQSYEQLCFDTEPAMRALCEFVGVPFDVRVLSPAGSGTELISGNSAMKKNAAKMSALRYDDRWLHRSDWWLLPWLTWGANRLNAGLVYAPVSTPQTAPPRADAPAGRQSG